MAKLKLSDIKFNGVYKLKVDTYAQYGYSKGDPVQIVFLQHNNIQFKRMGDPLSQQLGCQISQLDFYTQKKDQIEASIKEHELEIEKAKAKLKWMVATNSEEYDEDEFKVWHTLEIIEDPKTNKTDKAKAIAALIKDR